MKMLTPTFFSFLVLLGSFSYDINLGQFKILRKVTTTSINQQQFEIIIQSDELSFESAESTSFKWVLVYHPYENEVSVYLLPVKLNPTIFLMESFCLNGIRPVKKSKIFVYGKWPIFAENRKMLVALSTNEMVLAFSFKVDDPGMCENLSLKIDGFTFTDDQEISFFNQTQRIK